MFSYIIKSIILAIAGMMLFSCENSISRINELALEEDTLAAITTYDIIYERSDSGFVQVKLSSPLMKLFLGKDASTGWYIFSNFSHFFFKCLLMSK